MSVNKRKLDKYKNSIDVVAGQESWEMEDTKIAVEGYKWFGKPRGNQNSQRDEDGVGFLVRECLVDEVEFITDVHYEESVWMKVRGGRGSSAFYIGCVYMPTDCTNSASIEGCYGKDGGSLFRAVNFRHEEAVPRQ